MTLWNTFDSVRPALERQYLDVKPDPDTGLDKEALYRQAEKYIASHDSRQPRILTRAALLELVLTKAQIHIDPRDWFADHITGTDLLLHYQHRFKTAALETLPMAETHQREEAVQAGVWDTWLDLSHTTPDWESLLKLGVSGLRDRALTARESASDEKAVVFYAAVARCFDAMCCYIERLADQAEKVGAIRVLATLRALAQRPPQTFHEALQLAYLYHEVQEIEGEWVRSMGLFDRLYYPFYRADLDAGRLTRDQAKELLKFFWIKFYAKTQGRQAGKNFCMGGLKPDGSDAVNDLTELAYETYSEMKVVDPKLTMRVHCHSPNAILRQVADCLKQGLTATVFMNDDVAFPMFLRRGKKETDVFNYVAIGCYEPAIMGREMCCSMVILFNLAKIVELTLARPDFTPENFATFYTCYQNLLRAETEKAMHIARLQTALWPDVNPSPLLSGTMRDCIISGRDVSEAGTRYNTSGVMCAGIGSAVDSLYAVKELVYERGLCSFAELVQAVQDNWRSYENLRQIAISRIPKWGNNHEGVDALARDLATFVSSVFNHAPNGKGATFQTGMWSIDHNRTFGKKTGALPDGRFAGEELSKNLGASIGRDRRGVTALIQSAAKLDHCEFADGSVLDITLHPSAVSGVDGADLIVNLLRTYFAKGGLAIHFNIFDAETLRQAQREPERYAHLQVRVCGWNSRFIDLDAAAQEAFIAVATGAQ